MARVWGLGPQRLEQCDEMTVRRVEREGQGVYCFRVWVGGGKGEAEWGVGQSEVEFHLRFSIWE
jgi:hypothetical protein